MRIAILLTTYNRKQKTLDCLRSLEQQTLPENTELKVYLTDDNSVDGTAQAVKQQFPKVRLLQGTGSLFWAGGMRNSWKAALIGKYDSYLLLNDDTTLQQDAIARLLVYNINSALQQKEPAICIGNTCNTEGKISYGGKRLNSRLSLKSAFVYNEKDFEECDLGNANIMLVPAQIVKKIGILSDVFTHGIADYDYTLKAKRAGFKVLVAPGFLGVCMNEHGHNWKSSNVKLKDRISFLKSPKGLAYEEHLFFVKSHLPLYYPVAFLKLWTKTLFPFFWDVLKK